MIIIPLDKEIHILEIFYHILHHFLFVAINYHFYMILCTVSFPLLINYITR
jgi:hypothetical protein